MNSLNEIEKSISLTNLKMPLSELEIYQHAENYFLYSMATKELIPAGNTIQNARKLLLLRFYSMMDEKNREVIRGL